MTSNHLVSNSSEELTYRFGRPVIPWHIKPYTIYHRADRCMVKRPWRLIFKLEIRPACKHRRRERTVGHFATEAEAQEVADAIMKRVRAITDERKRKGSRNV